jgi:hypothetical protein
MGIGTILTVLGLFAAYEWRDKKTGTWQGPLKDIIPVGGIILALATPLISSIFVPILDYNVIANNNTDTIKIKIDNLGFKSAENVQIYLNSPGLNFTKLISNPLIFNGTASLTSDNLTSGSGIFYISKLASKSQTIVNATTYPKYTESNKLTVYVRSGESAAYHNLFSVSSAYLILALILVFDSVYIIYRKWDPQKVKKGYLAIANAVATLLILLILFFGTCDGAFDCHIGSV